MKLSARRVVLASLAAAVAAPLLALTPASAASSPEPAPSASGTGGQVDPNWGPGGRIVGGDLATSPEAGALIYGGGANCTAVQLDQHWALTAAHCLSQGATDEGYSVRFGSLDSLSGGEVHKVSKIVRHPDFDWPSNDIALLKVEGTMTTKAPARLATAADYSGSYWQRPAEIYGYGNTQADWTEPSRYLKVATGRIEDISCGTTATFKRLFPDKTFPGPMFECSGTNGHVAGGDSGGPLFITNATGERVLAGVAAIATKPTDAWAAYSSAVYFGDWIRGTIAADSTDPGSPEQPGDPGEHDSPVSFHITAQDSSSYTATVDITNRTAATMKDWKLSFKLPAGTTVTSAWGDGELAQANGTRSGDTVTLRAPGWNSDLPAGATAHVTVTGATTPGASIKLSEAHLNGQPVR